MSRTDEDQFYPYTDNGGTSLAIAGKDYCVVASDTRLSDGYAITCRYAPKTYIITPTSMLAVNGFYADGMMLARRLKVAKKRYIADHERQLSINALSQLLSTVLYEKRFFPYYVSTILGGIGDKGEGLVYGYDPVGSFKKEPFLSYGSASHMIQPFLDNQLSAKNLAISLEEAVNIAKDAFVSVTERDIHTGDHLEIHVITQSGIRKEAYGLKKD